MASSDEWWRSSDSSYLRDRMEQSIEEYDNEMIYKDIEANISNANLNAIENELRHLDLTFEKTPSNNIITVSGRDENVLNGTELLDAFQRYDRHACYYE